MAELIVLMGPTGAGKSVQGDLLASEMGGVHLSSGNLLRQNPHAAALLADGRLAPAEEVEAIVGKAVDAIPPGQADHSRWLPQNNEQRSLVGRRIART